MDLHIHSVIIYCYKLYFWPFYLRTKCEQKNVPILFLAWGEWNKYCWIDGLKSLDVHLCHTLCSIMSWRHRDALQHMYVCINSHTVLNSHAEVYYCPSNSMFHATLSQIFLSQSGCTVICWKFGEPLTPIDANPSSICMWITSDNFVHVFWTIYQIYPCMLLAGRFIAWCFQWDESKWAGGIHIICIGFSK